MHKQKQLKAQHLTNERIEKEVDKLGPQVREDFDICKAHLADQLYAAESESQESLAAFLFAFSHLSNVIAERFNVKR